MNFIALIGVVIFVWVAMCTAKVIAKELICKDCILKKKCEEHRKLYGTTFCDDKNFDNHINNYPQNPFMA